MLSKKMAFSLMSLITLLALAFAVPSAMAGFGASFNVDDVSLSGANDVEAVGATSSVIVHVFFDHVVTLEAVQAAFGTDAYATDKIDILNSYGSVIDDGKDPDNESDVDFNSIAVSVREIDALADNARNDGKNFTITIGNVPAGQRVAD